MNYVQRIVARQQKEYKKETYINFKKDAIVSKLNKSDLENTVDWLINNDYKFIKHTTLRMKMIPKSYSLTYNDHIIRLTCFDGSKYYWYSTNYHDDAKNVETPNSFKTFRKMFKKRTGTTLLEAFGKTLQSFKVFVPKPLYYINSEYKKGVWYNEICEEDYSSHYPCSALGKLPDANTLIEIDGFVEPNEDYPFAFYPDSGNCTVYNEFNSRDWLKYVQVYSAKAKTNKYLPKYFNKDTKTILMQESKYNLKDEIMHFYNLKSNSKKDTKDYFIAKMFLLKFIGMMEQCNSKVYSSYPFAHLAAIIKWRSNIKMFKTIKMIGTNNVIQVCVDGIIHSGEPIGTDEKEIGSLNTQISNAKFIHRGINQFILRNNTSEERKHAGLDINTDSDNIMTWMASPKVDFITYMKNNYLIEEM